MKLLGPPRQPFLGIALAAAAGIGLGDFLEITQQSMVVAAIAIAIGGIILLWRPNVLITYCFVFFSFLILHLRSS